MTRLRSCDACSRHVRITEQSCPFCKHTLTAANLPVAPKLPSGLSRAQRLAVAAAFASGQALAACADSTPQQPDTRAAGTGASAGKTASAAANGGSAAASSGNAGIGVATPVYGAPLAGNPGIMATPPYGASPPPPPTAGKKSDPVPDAGTPDDDAGTTTVPDAGHMVHPVYGAPPVP
jgi:hypothetical protein